MYATNNNNNRRLVTLAEHTSMYATMQGYIPRGPVLGGGGAHEPLARGGRGPHEPLTRVDDGELVTAGSKTGSNNNICYYGTVLAGA